MKRVRNRRPDSVRIMLPPPLVFGIGLFLTCFYCSFLKSPRIVSRFPQPKIVNHLGRRLGGASAVAQLEIEVAQIDEDAKPLAEDEHRIALVERVGEQQQPPAD